MFKDIACLQPQFYELRAEITKILIEEHGFNAIATEAGEASVAYPVRIRLSDILSACLFGLRIKASML